MKRQKRVIVELDGLNGNAVLRKYTWGLDLSGALQGAGGTLDITARRQGQVGGLLAMQATQGTADPADDANYAYFLDATHDMHSV